MKVHLQWVGHWLSYFHRALFILFIRITKVSARILFVLRKKILNNYDVDDVEWKKKAPFWKGSTVRERDKKNEEYYVGDYLEHKSQKCPSQNIFYNNNALVVVLF